MLYYYKSVSFSRYPGEKWRRYRPAEVFVSADPVQFTAEDRQHFDPFRHPACAYVVRTIRTSATADDFRRAWLRDGPGPGPFRFDETGNYLPNRHQRRHATVWQYCRKYRAF